MGQGRAQHGTILAGLLAVAFGAACAPALEPSRWTASPLPEAPLSPAQARESWAAATRVLEARCVVCHGCYDAPCQLKLEAPSGIVRGASPALVYEGERLLAAPTTRLDVDARDREGWRARGFHAVLPEPGQRDPNASLLLRMLALKRAHPLPTDRPLPQDFTFELDRAQSCPDAARFDAFAEEHPLWGMPYAFPALDEGEEAALTRWVEVGAPVPSPPPLAPALEAHVARWEELLNQPSNKARLMSRYLYEHLFLASLFFEGVDDTQYFRLVRSRTPPGSEVDEIATRRPFDDPEVDRLYYRLVRRDGATLAKTLLAYPLSDARHALFTELFLAPDYEVKALPSYAPAVAANPFRAFEAIPVRSRYRFLLTEAAFTIGGFIKGPVCRGQVALNVIHDRFWVFFVDPDRPLITDEAAFLARVTPELDMPAESGSSSLAVLLRDYGEPHARYVKARNAQLMTDSDGGRALGPERIWAGDDADVALTVLRHFDSATVAQGLLGPPPDTVWVIDYPLLERVHYLLVAGFDVFGNIGHQLSTRVYMDFLRWEGEANFLAMLPAARRAVLAERWYDGITSAEQEEVRGELLSFAGEPGGAFETATPELELLTRLRARVAPHASRRWELPQEELALRRLAEVRGVPASLLPETVILTVRDGDARQSFSILRESAHRNVAHLLHESARRLPERDALTVVPGLLPAYPNALFEVDRAALDAFVTAVAGLRDPAGYLELRRRWGLSRTSEHFWRASDRLQSTARAGGPRDNGLLDFNHLEPL